MKMSMMSCNTMVSGLGLT